MNIKVLIELISRFFHNAFEIHCVYFALDTTTQTSTMIKSTTSSTTTTAPTITTFEEGNSTTFISKPLDHIVENRQK